MNSIPLQKQSAICPIISPILRTSVKQALIKTIFKKIRDASLHYIPINASLLIIMSISVRCTAINARVC